MKQDEKIEIEHIFKNGSCLNCGTVEEFAEDEPCEKEDTEWIFEQMLGTRGAE